MEGVVTHPHGSAPRRVRRTAALAAAVLCLGLLLLGAGSASPSEALAAKASQGCPAPPYGFAPTGAATDRFTMLIRINTQGNVNTWTQFNQAKGGLAGYVRPQDIFVINTRFTGGGGFPAVTQDVAKQLTAGIRAAFPCNRIIDLTGLSLDPTQPGYAFTGIDDPNVYTLMTDYEQMDWTSGAATDPTRPPWAIHFKKAFPLLRGWNFGFMSTVAANPIGAGKRTGLAPQDYATWNYGQIAQNLNKQNLRLGSRKLGPQSVQTQNSCADGGIAGFGARAKALRMQYTFEFITKKVKVPGKKRKRTVTMRLPLKKKARPNMTNLAMEISFTDSPNAFASQAILSTSAAQAAACVPPAMKQGISAFFFFAAEDAMRLLFAQPQIAPLRPWSGPGAATSGGVVPGGP